MIDIVDNMEIELYAEEQPAYDRPFPSLPREPMDLDLFDIFEENAEDDLQEQSEGAQDGTLEEQLQRAGFSTSNASLTCVQLVNALQAQMDVLEQVIFRKAPSGIFSYGVGFNLNDDCAFEDLLAGTGSEAEPIFQASLGESKTSSGRAAKDRSGSNSTAEEEVARILAQEWEMVSPSDKMAYLALRRKIDDLRRVVAECLTSRQGDENVCLLCGDSFGNGRQLGGHMSRRHPGHSTDYSKKKRLHSAKAVERDRRKYFKGIKSPPSGRRRPFAKTTKRLSNATEQL